MSGLINKAKDILHSDKKDNAATDNPHSTNAGPHGSNAANKADPRVDSDRDTVPTHGTHTTGAGLGSTTHGTHNTHGTTGSGLGSNTTSGPHSGKLANQADPRVDSDRDGRGIGQGGIGSTGTALGGNTHGTHNTHGTTGAGLGSTTHGTTTHGTTGAGYGSNTTSGPHSGKLANQADPRVDSDRDGRGIGQGGIGSTGTALGGNTHGTTTHGTTGAGYGSTGTTTGAGYGSDPRVHSDVDSGFGTSGAGHTGAGYAGTNPTSTTGAGYGSGTTGTTGAATHGAGSALPGSGTASNTAGPHNSNLLNKLDPRVDSNLDGSKTVGGNATHQ